ncbi:MAG: nucleoside-diphosphate kinase [Bacteroidota bacterium]
MTGDITLSMIKPDIIQDGHVGEIITMIEREGFRIKALKLTQLSLESAGQFYAAHKERPFYKELCEYMSSNPIIAMILSKDSAVAVFRRLIGATNPTEAAPGTIRQRFAKSITANAIHGSDADETALIEAKFFFPELSL